MPRSKKKPTLHPSPIPPPPGTGFTLTTKSALNSKDVKYDYANEALRRFPFAGTPFTAATVGALEDLPDGRTRSGQLFREIDKIHIPIYVLPAKAVLQMSRVFTGESAGFRKRRLCFAVVGKVQDLGLLRGYSSLVVAGASIRFASFATGQDVSILSEQADKDLLPLKGPMRTAYNELWLVEHHFEDVLERHGGKVGLLAVPKGKDGKPDKHVLGTDSRGRKEYLKGERMVMRSKRSRKVKAMKARGPSRLRQEIVEDVNVTSEGARDSVDEFAGSYVHVNEERYGEVDMGALEPGQRVHRGGGRKRVEVPRAPARESRSPVAGNGVQKVRRHQRLRRWAKFLGAFAIYRFGVVPAARKLYGAIDSYSRSAEKPFPFQQLYSQLPKVGVHQISGEAQRADQEMLRHWVSPSTRLEAPVTLVTMVQPIAHAVPKMEGPVL